MTLPGFSAGASLGNVRLPYQREAMSGGSWSNNEVVAQSKADQAAAQHILDVVGFGKVHCVWEEYCEGRMPNIQCGIRERCYWWPY